MKYQVCELCQGFVETAENSAGTCKARPPMPDSKGAAVWPTVSVSDGCCGGEYVGLPNGASAHYTKGVGNHIFFFKSNTAESKWAIVDGRTAAKTALLMGGTAPQDLTKEQLLGYADYKLYFGVAVVPYVQPDGSTKAGNVNYAWETDSGHSIVKTGSKVMVKETNGSVTVMTASEWARRKK
jgi:hypothetical protein